MSIASSLRASVLLLHWLHLPACRGLQDAVTRTRCCGNRVSIIYVGAALLIMQ